MDTEDLLRLADHPRVRGLTVTDSEAESRLHVTKPLNDIFTEEIDATGDCYVTSFECEVGERGSEQICAGRLAQQLSVGIATGAVP
ncbi:hypothetical protein ABZ916_24520 [Streptomyces sp. NPDC046853]|uniref:hypothetical protein n=1 Tax=Streptomyces sp. NPDC046853 TaxID=3154920 RepID=UPI00340A931E